MLSFYELSIKLQIIINLSRLGYLLFKLQGFIILAKEEDGKWET